MIARTYTKKVEIWGVTSVSDGYGGFTTEQTLLKKKWVCIETKNSVRNTDTGQLQNELTTIFCFRGKDFTLDIASNFIIYKGFKYIIDRVENVDLIDIDLKAYCTQYNGTN